MLITSAACAAPWLIALRAPFGKTLILKEIPDLIALFAWIEEDECVRDDTIRIAKIAKIAKIAVIEPQTLHVFKFNKAWSHTS